MHRQLIFVFFAFILAACTSRNVREVDGVLVVDVEDVREEKDVAIEELAEDVEVIELEAADNAFFEFRRAWFSENYVVVRAANGLVRVFGRDGRFIGLLEGVDERAAVYDIAIDEGREEIYASRTLSDSLMVFGIDGRRKAGLPLKGNVTKAVLATCADGVALAQFDFTDKPSGFNFAVLGKDSARYLSNPSLCTQALGPEGNMSGFNYEIFGDCADGCFTFMTTFCDTLFRFDFASGRIVPELAVEMPNRHRLNAWDLIQEPSQEFNLMHITTLPRHYLINIEGTGGRSIIVDREAKKAWRGEIVWKGIDQLDNVENIEVSKPQFSGDYAYVVLPPKGMGNATIVRWKLATRTPPQPSPTGEGAKKLPLTNASIDKTNYNSPSPVGEGRGGVFLGHPSLAYDYALKSIDFLQQEQYDSAEYYRLLVNAPLTPQQQEEIDSRTMKALIELGDYREAQRYADLHSGRYYITNQLQMAEDQSHISELDQQLASSHRLRAWLIATLVLTLALSAAALLYIRYRKRRQLIATRRQLEGLMQERMMAVALESERTKEERDCLRTEMMRNHALIRRISAARRPLSGNEETLLHSVAEMLYPDLAARLQARSSAPLNKRELTICFLIRLGVPQLSIATLLDIKPASFRVAKSNLKRDRFRLPVEAELEEFICGV